jgi:gamma-carbonic anhydrase
MALINVGCITTSSGHLLICIPTTNDEGLDGHARIGGDPRTFSASGSPHREHDERLQRMLVEHRGRAPVVDPTAYVAPTAVVCGDVHIGPEARILFGAVITAEDGVVEIGARCVVMENALVRGRAKHPVRLGADVLVGPHAHVNGAIVQDGAFLATGSSLFPGSRLGRGVEVRINGVVHVNTALEDGAMVPIGWVAVGDPARILPPSEHEEIWSVQEGLDFPRTVYGLPRGGIRSGADASPDRVVRGSSRRQDPRRRLSRSPMPRRAQPATSSRNLGSLLIASKSESSAANERRSSDSSIARLR